MQPNSFHQAVTGICKKDPQYSKDAYFFVREAIDYTGKNLQKPRHGKGRHVSGSELLFGIRDYALTEFGPMAITVFRQWGIHETLDFGEIVFNLVEAGLLGKTDEDQKEDFEGVYDFEQEFVKPFKPTTEYRRHSVRRQADLKTKAGMETSK